MHCMEKQQSHKKENKEMIEIYITEFMSTAHQYLFGLMPAQHTALATTPMTQAH